MIPMSHDAQHRTPQPLADISAIVRASLRERGYPFSGQILECADCGPQTKLAVEHELIGLDWSIRCERCGERLQRSYTDPIDAISRWNQRQLERKEPRELTTKLSRAGGKLALEPEMGQQAC